MAKCTGIRCQMQYGYKVEECNSTECPYRTEPVTNADRIRAMNDEELAIFFSETFCHGYGKPQLAEWIKSPAEKEGK